MTYNMLNGLVELEYLNTGGDEISHYKTIGFKPEPATTYIKYILDNTSEWGYIYLFDWDTAQSDVIEYRYGTIVNEINNSWSNKIVSKVQYDGGWSRGDWRIGTGGRQ